SGIQRNRANAARGEEIMASSSQSVAINYGRAGLNLASGMIETLAADKWRLGCCDRTDIDKLKICGYVCKLVISLLVDVHPARHAK
ncbi:MAG: hypothetical protein Q8R81_15605, partial [Novosphingobium sp.]|uniref:hypothetical protein n=1 Tax=Novosphingobium sp. TaxID=1874826 RepID=UPI002734FCF7